MFFCRPTRLDYFLSASRSYFRAPVRPLLSKGNINRSLSYELPEFSENGNKSSIHSESSLYLHITLHSGSCQKSKRQSQCSNYSLDDSILLQIIKSIWTNVFKKNYILTKNRADSIIQKIKQSI